MKDIFDIPIVSSMSVRLRVPYVDESGVSRTKQSFKDECDINNILGNYERTGFISHVKENQGRYEDVSSGTDYREGLNVVLEAERMFMELPAPVRSKFENDPGKFLDFVSDPKNVKSMIDLGIAFEVKKDASLADVVAAVKTSSKSTKSDKPSKEPVE